MTIVTFVIAGALMLVGCTSPTGSDASQGDRGAADDRSAAPFQDRASDHPAAALSTPRPAAPTATEHVARASSRQSTAPSRPAATPVALEIPALGVDADIVDLGLNEDRTLEVPADFDRAGWYTGRPPPGAIGPAIIVGHVDSKDGPAVFYRLRDVVPGDDVLVRREDASTARFTVDRVEQHAKDEFPTSAVYGPTADATLRLITCGGSFDRRRRSYDDNVIVFASLAQP